MAISFPKQEARDESTDVIKFPAIIDDKSITCWISWEALIDHFGGARDPLRAFMSGRPRIEAKATLFINAKRFEPDGTVGIRTGDF